MKQFFLFAGSNYYPSGGWRDFAGSYETALEAVLAAAELADGHDWWHVIDSHTGGQVFNGNRK